MGVRRQAALWPGVALAVLLAVLAFVLSFDALRVVGLACGIQPALAWMFPLIIDGSTLAFTWAAWAFRTRAMRTVYPWLMLVAFSVISLVGNALHAHPTPVNGLLLPDWTASLIMTVPPIALLATTHMIVMAASRSFDEPEPAPAPEPEPAGPDFAPMPEPAPEPAEPEPEAGPDPAPVPEPAGPKTPEPAPEPEPEPANHAPDPESGTRDERKARRGRLERNWSTIVAPPADQGMFDLLGLDDDQTA